ncbi:hypothetical protein PM082_001116 [Marasmius tenuissimus]|nr:hypothetical protein PM082_001116 [Marasmius tenuissimus]
MRALAGLHGTNREEGGSEKRANAPKPSQQSERLGTIGFPRSRDSLIRRQTERGSLQPQIDQEVIGHPSVYPTVRLHRNISLTPI